MADKRISELTNITGANLADTDEFVVVDTSASETKAITYGELKKFTGTVTADGLTVGIGDNIGVNAGNGFAIDASSNIDFTSGGVKSLRIKEGDISFYEDTGTTPKFFWDASAESLGIGTSSPDAKIRIQNDNSTVPSLVIRDGGTPATHMVDISSNATGTAMRIDSSGNVGIGTSTGIDAPLTFAGSVGKKINLYSGSDYSIGIQSSELRLATSGFMSFYRSGYSGTESMRIDSSGNVLMGTTSVGTSLDGLAVAGADQAVSSRGNIYVYSTDSQAANKGGQITFGGSYTGTTETIWAAVAGRKENGTDTDTSGYLQFSTRASGGVEERMRIDSSGNVGIGTSSPSAGLHIDNPSNSAITAILDTDNSAVKLVFRNNTETGNNVQIGADGSNLVALTNGSERMRIDSSGNLLVGKTSTSSTVDGVTAFGVGAIEVVRPSSALLYLNRKTSDGDIAVFRKDGTTVGSIGTYANFPTIGKTDTGVIFQDSNNAIHPWNIGTNSANDGAIDLGVASHRFKDLYLSGGLRGDTTFKNNAGTTEYARFDASGNLLVGTTDTDPSNDTTGTGGIALGAASYISLGRANATPLLVNRIGTDGENIIIKKDGATVGSIGTLNSRLVVGSDDVALTFAPLLSPPTIYPSNTSGSGQDGQFDLGTSTARFDDIYATNALIQTSDRNEKQDIAELDEAERRVAVAAKGLLRKFRWKDAVAEKGDDARIHFGIIAQDLQAAFAAEGLDAGKYAMFIHTTWTDEETGEERSRMGVRYSELLAFIIAAI